MTTKIDEVLEFLRIANEKGFLNNNTAGSRRTACNKFFDILDEDQKNVEYVRDNLSVIKARFSNLNKDVAGTTVEEYGRRVQLVLNDFAAWKEDRAGWERSVSAKQSSRPSPGESEKKARAKKSAKTKSQPRGNGANHAPAGGISDKPDTRVVSFPIRPDFDLQVSLPRSGLSVSELKKLVYFLLPYATDWEPSDARTVFPMLEQDEDRP